jgi:hypothetical protein
MHFRLEHLITGKEFFMKGLATRWVGLAVLMLVAAPVSGQWAAQYATFDDATNGTGHRTASVAVFGVDDFVGMVVTVESLADLYVTDRNYMVPYQDADSAKGRLVDPGYGSGATAGRFDVWQDPSGDVQLFGAWRFAAGPNNRLYVANNDAFFHAILVFDYTPVGLVSAPYRMTTGIDNIFDIDVDSSGYVYIVADTSTDDNTAEVKVYRPIDAEGTTWGSSHDDAPVTTIDLPSGSTWRGLAVNADGSWLYLSDQTNYRVLRYTGSPEEGYTLDDGFSFEVAEADTDGVGRRASPLGLAYYDPNNLLAVASDVFLPPASRSASYQYGRMYIVHPETGAVIDTIDVAQWNFDHTGTYSDRGGGVASGYTSTYDVDWDEEGNLYSVSYYGWTVEKWHTDNLPVAIVTGVKGRAESTPPEEYDLAQNFPNPFNPSTVITYSLPRAEPVRLVVYNLLGQEVRTLVDGVRPAGSHTVRWDGTDNHGLRVAAGVYLYRLYAGSQTLTRKMTFVP